MRHDRLSRLARILEWTLLAIGVACLASYGWLTYQIRRVESDNRSAVTRMLAERERARAAKEPAGLQPSAIPEASPDSGLIGQIDIPRLHVSAAVKFGDDPDALKGAVGYLPDTAPPWEQGNSVLAAHRDGLFRALAKIRAGDEISLSTRHGDFQYRVSRTFIVNPTDVWVLEASPDVDLTLITCYPFVFVGHAPQRFVVRARKVDLRSVRPGPDVEREGDE